MAGPSSPSSSMNSALDPMAPTFTMNTNNSTDAGTAPTPAPALPSQPSTNDQHSNVKGKQKSENPKSESSDKRAAAGAEGKLTAAELKKQKAAEKAARRAEKVAEKTAAVQQPEVAGSAEQSQQPGSSNESDMTRRKSVVGKTGERSRRDSVSGVGGSKPLPYRPGQQSSKDIAPPQDQKLDKRVPILSHLYPSSVSKRASIATASREIHPAVLTLGLQIRDYVICGATCRTIATLLVFKKVIQSYSTPAGVALSRHLTTHLSHQITYLSHARPLNVAQGNSIRWLKKLISALDPDLAENEAKTFLCAAIDGFIRERMTLADEVIVREACGRIEDDGDVVLTYGKSSVVEKTLLAAWKGGKRFKVVVVDSRPLFEGKALTKGLIGAGMKDVTYCLLNGLADVIAREGVTKCILGASAMLGNGRLSSRAGTAMVAMMAKDGGYGGAQGRAKVPVIVLCESIKFTARVALDSLVMNEIGDADVLVETEEKKILTQVPTQQKQEPAKKGGKPKQDEEEQNDKKGLEGWRDQPNMYLLNLMYDVTPAEYLDIVVSELGSLPPSAVPVVNGVHGGDE